MHGSTCLYSQSGIYLELHLLLTLIYICVFLSTYLHISPPWGKACLHRANLSITFKPQLTQAVPEGLLRMKSSDARRSDFDQNRQNNLADKSKAKSWKYTWADGRSNTHQHGTMQSVPPCVDVERLLSKSYKNIESWDEISSSFLWQEQNRIKTEYLHLIDHWNWAWMLGRCTGGKKLIFTVHILHLLVFFKMLYCIFLCWI